MTISLEHIMAAFISLLGGAIFWHGFNRMHKYRLIRDIPRSKIRSIAMGLVEIHGSCRAEELLYAPFSRSECVYFKYEIKEYRRHKSRDSKGHTRTTKSWDTIAMGDRQIPFWATDDTGQVMVYPEKAEFDVSLRHSYHQDRGAFDGITMFISALKGWQGDREAIPDTDGLQLIPLGKKGKRPGRATVGDRRYYEYLLAPDDILFVMGTAATDADAPDKVLIRRGQNEDTFIISDKSENALLKSIRNQMIAAFIFGALFFGAGVVWLFHLAGAF